MTIDLDINVHTIKRLELSAFSLGKLLNPCPYIKNRFVVFSQRSEFKNPTCCRLMGYSTSVTHRSKKTTRQSKFTKSLTKFLRFSIDKQLEIQKER